jgi:hypothetical protein
MMKKKGDLSINYTAIIIIVLVIIVIMLLFEAKAGELYKNLMNKNICKSSVYAQDISTIKDIALPSDIKCPTQRIEIEERDPEKIKQELAKLYYDVCDEFGQGTLNLFGNRETTFCVIRDKISFKHKDIVIENFPKYLAETNIPGKEITYAEFCSGFKTERAAKIFEETEIEQLENVPIDTSREYTILFVYSKGEDELKEITDFLFGTSPQHIGMYIGAGLIAGGGILIYTGEGAILGAPMVIAGKIILGGGLKVLGISAIINYFTNKNLKMEWASFFLIREYNEEELKELPCKYMPAEQY